MSTKYPRPEALLLRVLPGFTHAFPVYGLGRKFTRLAVQPWPMPRRIPDCSCHGLQMSPFHVLRIGRKINFSRDSNPLGILPRMLIDNLIRTDRKSTDDISRGEAKEKIMKRTYSKVAGAFASSQSPPWD